jgi:hypothetical protein
VDGADDGVEAGGGAEDEAGVGALQHQVAPRDEHLPRRRRDPERRGSGRRLVRWPDRSPPGAADAESKRVIERTPAVRTLTLPWTSSPSPRLKPVERDAAVSDTAGRSCARAEQEHVCGCGGLAEEPRMSGGWLERGLGGGAAPRSAGRCDV